MNLTVTGLKGGVGKTTTAVHLAYYLSELAPTCLLDGDPRKFATRWASRGKDRPFPFRVAPVEAAVQMGREHTHIVLDIGQAPSEDDLAAMADYCDLLILPTSPSALDADGVGETIRVLQSIETRKFKVLLTKVASHAAKEVLDLRMGMLEIGAPVFGQQIPLLKAFERAADAGVTVDRVRDDNARVAWMAYEAVGEELML